ncbi:PGAP1-like protein-domain-containing protein [Flammula alnicola]|nr:PGAP1-like protein-domain-containing protein [Flammula alnicola]
MPAFATGFLGIFSLLALLLFYLASSDTAENLSPQGCRMSWMSPSYVQQANFNTSWSPLARRYSLWLYREVGWDSARFRRGSLPVLFIPGNAGSSHQTILLSPFVISPTFHGRSLEPLDFFADNYHGTSMGGVVATSLLPSNNISAIITMSTPHTLPPARFDSRIDRLYDKLQSTLEEDPTPIISICGGATDMMIPSESCVLPRTSKDVFRRTVFTSALEGAWTGVGHREMVWCHQVRNSSSRAVVLDKWLRDGHSLPPTLEQHGEFDISDPSKPETLSAGQKLILKQPRDSKRYLLPVQGDSSTDAPQKITVLVSQGSIWSVGPENQIPLQVSIFRCTGPTSTSVECTALKPDTLKLIPSPVLGKSFPVPHEGSDESEGVVLYESHVPRVNGQHWIGIKVDGADGRGWKIVILNTFLLALLMGPLSVSVPVNAGLSNSFTFPNLLSHTLVVYRVITHRYAMPSCSDALLPPLLMHTSHPAETHYFPLTNFHNQRTLLHTHLAAPLIDQTRHFSSFLNLTIVSSAEPECQQEFTKFDIAIDWSATLGRWASRYLHTLVSWAAGVASIVVFLAWAQIDEGAPMPTVGQSLTRYGHMMLRHFLPGSLIFSLVPLPESLYLGNKGLLFLAPIAPLILCIASGLVCVVWWVLLLLLTEHHPFSLIICLMIFVFVPWQVAYLGCWLLHLHTCASSMRHQASVDPRSKIEAVPLVRRRRESAEAQDEVLLTSRERRPSDVRDVKRDNINHNMHLLLLMTWLLPLTAPVLAVWVRTLLTAGYTTPFDGDHNFLAVLPFLILVDFASWTPGPLFEKTRFEKRIPLHWLFAVMAGTAFIYGSRKPYLVLDVARVAMWIIVICKIGRRYWGGSPWTGGSDSA